MIAYLPVEMVRGGFITMCVVGDVHEHEDGAGQRWDEVLIRSVSWPGGGEADRRLINMKQLETDFAETVDEDD